LEKCRPRIPKATAVSMISKTPRFRRVEARQLWVG
jgi:hypothetical protein